MSRGGPRVGWEGEGRSRSRGGAVARVTRVAASMGRRCGVERACGSPGVALQAVMTADGGTLAQRQQRSGFWSGAATRVGVQEVSVREWGVGAT